MLVVTLIFNLRPLFDYDVSLYPRNMKSMAELPLNLLVNRKLACVLDFTVVFFSVLPLSVEICHFILKTLNPYLQRYPEDKLQTQVRKIYNILVVFFQHFISCNIVK